jgi:hypothetical protein
MVRYSREATTLETQSPSDQQRAPRFPIQTRVDYRENSGQDWRLGTSINISRTGILFRPADDLSANTVLELRILLRGEPAANVECWGPVVRKESSDSECGLPAVAVSIRGYRLCSS